MWQQNLKCFFLLQNNFSINWTFAVGMSAIAKFTLFSIMIVRFMTRACLRVFSAAWHALIALGRVRPHSQRSFSRKKLSLVPHSIISLLESSGGYQLHIWNWACLIVTNSWSFEVLDFWSSCCLYVKNSCVECLCFPRVTVFWKLVENRRKIYYFYVRISSIKLFTVLIASIGEATGIDFEHLLSISGCSSDIASSHVFCPSKVTEYVASRFSGGEFRIR